MHGGSGYCGGCCVGVSVEGYFHGRAHTLLLPLLEQPPGTRSDSWCQQIDYCGGGGVGVSVGGGGGGCVGGGGGVGVSVGGGGGGGCVGG